MRAVCHLRRSTGDGGRHVGLDDPQLAVHHCCRGLDRPEGVNERHARRPWPDTGKFSTARCVCAPHRAEAGTRTSPIVSCSIRNSSADMTPRYDGHYGSWRWTDTPFSDLLPLGPDDTPYRLLTTDGVSTVEAAGRTFLQVDPEALTLLTSTAFRDIAHWLRPAHLQQLRRILDDPEASANDKFVALDLLKNANIAAGGVLPMCQDTGTAIVMGKRGELRPHRRRRRAGHQRRHPADLRDARTCGSRRWRRSRCGTRRTPAPTSRPRSSSTPPVATPTSCCSWPRAAGRPTRAISSRRPRRCSTGRRCCASSTRSCARSAPRPARRTTSPSSIGGTSAEFALKTAKYASAHYLDTLPDAGSRLGHGFRDLELEADVLALTQGFGIGAQFGGKYFCHDVRVDPPAPPWRVVPGGRRRVVLGRPPGARQDHGRGRVPRAARGGPGALPARGHPRRPRATTSSTSTSTGRWTRSAASCPATR